MYFNYILVIATTTTTANYPDYTAVTAVFMNTSIMVTVSYTVITAVFTKMVTVILLNPSDLFFKQAYFRIL